MTRTHFASDEPTPFYHVAASSSTHYSYDRNIPLRMDHGTRSNSRPTLVPDSRGGMRPVSEQRRDSEGSNPSARRRIPVASGYPRNYTQATNTRTGNQSYTWSFNEEAPIDTYGLHAPNYSHGLGQDQCGTYFGQQDNTRAWSGHSGQGSYSEKDPYITSQMAYGLGSRLPSVTGEVSPLSMASLRSSLPTGNMTTHQARQLPVPIRAQSISSSSSVGTGASSGDLSSVRPRLPSHGSNPNLSAIDVAPLYRTFSRNSWEATNNNPSDRQDSALMPPPASKPSSSGATIAIADVPSTNIGPMGYVPLSIGDNEGSAISTAPSLTYSSSSPSSSYISVSSIGSRPSFRGYSGLPETSSASEASYVRSRNTSQTSSTALYSYSTDSGARSDNEDTDTGTGGTLVSGQKYSPLHEPPPKFGISGDTIRDNDFNEGVDRESISSLSARY
ncbi:MAG: hypothetical protein M1820_009715 [Bogoriella megaspora]|nr:MAG: hypothetical protein M1820_009715 [Bogoriella megaspora]